MGVVAHLEGWYFMSWAKPLLWYEFVQFRRQQNTDPTLLRQTHPLCHFPSRAQIVHWVLGSA